MTVFQNESQVYEKKEAKVKQKLEEFRAENQIIPNKVRFTPDDQIFFTNPAVFSSIIRILRHCLLIFLLRGNKKEAIRLL